MQTQTKHLQLQEVFDLIYQKFIYENTGKSQFNKQSFYNNSINGVGCFWGYILSNYFSQDELVRFDDLDYPAISSLMQINKKIYNLLKQIDEHTAQNLQAIHDIQEPENWEHYLNHFASVNNLVIPVLIK